MKKINERENLAAGAVKRWRIYFLLLVGIVAFQAHQGLAQSNSNVSKVNSQQSVKEKNGQNDFDFEIGTWKTKLRRLKNPLSGSATWVEYEGTTVVRKVWDGRANLVELDVSGSAGRIEALSLRL